MSKTTSFTDTTVLSIERKEVEELLIENLAKGYIHPRIKISIDITYLLCSQKE